MSSGPTLVGLDTATPVLSVAATCGGEPSFERSFDPEPGERPAHARELLATVEEAADAAGGWPAVDAIAVGLGPGSYTGLRIGIATARGLAQGLRKPLRPVSSLAAVARGMAPGFSERDRQRLPVLDARRGQAFAALYGGTGEALWEPFVATPQELVERVRSLAQAPLAAGDGSIRFRGELEAAGADVPADDDEAHRISARHLCVLAADVPDTEPARVEPIYLRPPDAELWLEQQRREGNRKG